MKPSKDGLKVKLRVFRPFSVMQPITQPEQLLDWQFKMFMINTLAFQLEKWAVLPEDAPIIKENREAIKHLRNKCRKLIELNEARALSEVEEDFYSVGDEFHAILGFIQSQKDAHLRFNLLEVVTAMAMDDHDYLKEFFLSAAALINPEPAQPAIMNVIQMYCPEMPKEKKQAFAKLIQITK